MALTLTGVRHLISPSWLEKGKVSLPTWIFCNPESMCG